MPLFLILPRDGKSLLAPNIKPYFTVDLKKSMYKYTNQKQKFNKKKIICPYVSKLLKTLFFLVFIKGLIISQQEF
ncbi:hypothetical protein DU52_13195 [Methanosarcina mazei]|uniref:Uncharacterized protein n=2 Tax=Methanosarcina mazei TaxID=2209 RepID=A0A0F8HGH3_METMZ|nr:hypothetical protein MSMAC_2692 [Methanosarcina mazei C16]KKG34295.1 hypothetical protein DU52_13195 [Methanosarcina mazei]KKG75816.1 hypothetical protein DU63_18810 [Methanosarcina mazei]KKH56683.1 hypothetical protein DU74_15360 [Methanosarcina mazei]